MGANLALTAICSLALAGAALAGAGTPGSEGPATPAPQGAAAAPQGAAAAPQEKAASTDGDIRVYWKNGLFFETQDKTFKARFSGRAQWEWAWFDGDEAALGLDLEDASGIRRAYLGFEGSYQSLDFKIEYDFAKGATTAQDVYLRKNFETIGNVTVGHFKEPFGLEELTSDLHTTFMERSIGVFSPSRNQGIMFSDACASERMTWAVGAFRSDSNGAGSSTGDDEYAFTGRVTWLPWFADEGAKLGHLGLAASTRATDNNTVTASAKPESDLAPIFVTSGAIAGDEYDQFGLEAMVVAGPLSFQAEYAQAMMDGTATAGDDPDLTGWYAYASWFLTGEHRNYKRSNGTADRVKPESNFGKDGGMGAWELGLRFSSLDFDEATTDETLDDVTLGLNWYLNAFAKIQANIVHADRGLTDEAVDIFQIRFQFDF